MYKKIATNKIKNINIDEIQKLTFFDPQDWKNKPIPQSLIDHMIKLLDLYGNPKNGYTYNQFLTVEKIEVGYRKEYINDYSKIQSTYKFYTAIISTIKKSYKNGFSKVYESRCEIFSELVD